MTLRKQMKQNGRRCLCNNWGKAVAIVLLSTAIFLLFAIIETILSMLLGISTTTENYDTIEGIWAGIPDHTLLSFFLTSIMTVGAFLIVTPLALGILGWYRKLSDGESEDILSIFSCFAHLKLFLRALLLSFNRGLRSFLWGIAYLGLPLAGVGVSASVLERSSGENALIGKLGIAFSAVLLIVMAAFWFMKIQRYFLAPYYLLDGKTTVRQAIRRSVHATSHCRDEVFLYKLSFAGWWALCMSVLPVLYVAPYYQTTTMIYARILMEKDERSHQLAVYDTESAPEEFASTRQFDAQKKEEEEE